MAEIISGFVSPIMQLGEWLWTPVKRGLGYMIHYKRNIQSLNLQVEKLEAIKIGYQEMVDAVQMNGEEVKPEIQIWLKDANKAIANAATLKVEAEASIECISRMCPDLRWRYSIGKKAMKERVAVNKLQEEGKFNTVSIPVPRPIQIESIMSTNGFEAFEATRKAMDQVMTALRDDEVTIIGVYGTGGVGKTTMVKHIGAQACKDRLFDHVIMAVFSQNPNLMKVQGELSDMLGLKLQEETELGRAGRLKERILQRKRTLIILDDIWNAFVEFTSIGIPSHLQLQGCNSKVLLTTRRLNVCHAMESQVRVPLNFLSEEDSWNLFAKKAGKSFEPTAFYDLARKVARECAGLPIALIAVARALGDKDFNEWKSAARELEKSRPANHEDEGDVYKCIKLSYDYLNGEDAKSCFLLCSLFREDSNIAIQDLFRYGFGNGLFRDGETLEEARDRANSVIEYLKASSLLLDGKFEKYVRMHDVIRDMAIRIASSDHGHRFLVKAGWELQDWPNDADESYTTISLKENCIRKLPQELVCPKLQILLLDGNENLQEIPEAFFQSLNALRVLDLRSTDILLLPSSFNFLINLQTLNLDGCGSLKDISVIGELKKLEILSLMHCDFEEIPEEIGNLANLKLLDLTWNWKMKTIPPKVISRLSRLEELHMEKSFGDWGSKVEGEEGKTNAGLDEVICLSHLTTLTVQIFDAKCIPTYVGFHPNWEIFDIIIRKQLFYGDSLNNSRVLRLDTTINSLPSWFNSVVTERAKEIIYKECRGLHNILVECATGRLHGLMSLDVMNCHQMLSLMNSTTISLVPNKPVLKNLEELYVGGMNDLKELCVGDLPHGSLGNLKLLKVEYCHVMVNALLQSNLLQKLQNLEVLVIQKMEVLEYVFQFEGLKKEQTVLGKWRKMRLAYLAALKKIWNGPAHYAIFHNLKILEVYWCLKLKSIFTADVSQCLLQLEELEVMECGSLETIIGPSEGTLKNKIIFPQLNHLKLCNLQLLESFYSGGSADIECPSLERLTVYECPKFSMPTSEFHSQKQIQFQVNVIIE